jgi:G3E family GTPase
MLLFPSADIGMFGRRQRYARAHRIPVTIVTSSAGTPEDRDIAVVIDRFGAGDVVALGNGCACCTVRPQLQTAFRRLLAERAEGRYFARVVIETGEEVSAILRTFATERALGAEFYVEDFPADAIGKHDDGVRRFALTEATPLPWQAFARFMTSLMALRGADLLHVKGLLNVAGCTGPVAVAFMQHLAHPPVELAAWPDAARDSRIAFVTRNLEENTVRILFDAVRGLG